MKIGEIWDALEEQIGGIFLFIAVILVFGQIVARSVFSFGVSGLYELAVYFSIYSIFLTSSIAVKNNIHIRIDILGNIVGPRWAFALEMVALLLMLVVSLTLLYSGVLLIQESLMLGEHTLGTISMPVWIIQLILPVSGLLMTLRILQRALKLFRQGPQQFRVVSSDLNIL